MKSLLEQAIRIHKTTQEGISNKYPLFMLRWWYRWELYSRKCILITETINSDFGELVLHGFILYDLNRKEIVVISVRKDIQDCGVGSKLLRKIKDDSVIVRYNKNNPKVDNFYKKNGFNIIIEQGYETSYSNIYHVIARRK